MAGKCKAGYYKSNEVVTHSPLVCFGGFGQPRCEHLQKCLTDNKERITPRRFNNLFKKLGFKKD